MSEKRGRPKTKDSKAVCFYVDNNILEKMDEYAEETMIPKSAIVNIALKDFFKKREEQRI